ncbi:ribose-phosphate pyrophosphokinase [Candidatus Dependentiae bacterium]|nr:ribose-phosphate pyrophosphokinase [Candidatus Dependentiae bacterium]
MNYEVVSLPESHSLAYNVALRLNKELVTPKVQEFADGEIEVVFEPNKFNQKKVMLIHAPYGNVHNALVRFALLAHSASISGAQEIIGIIPYLWYMRQDKSAVPGRVGAWQIIAKLLEATGISQLITVEMHAAICEQMITVPLYNIKLRVLMAEHIKHVVPECKQCCFIAPDEGAFNRAQEIGQVFNMPVMVFKKKRFDVDKTKIISVSGSCGYDTVLIVDDIIATGGTAINACDKLREMGIKKVYGYFVHPVLPGNAIECIENSGFDRVFVSNSIPHTFDKQSKFTIFDISGVLAKKIKELV